MHEVDPAAVEYLPALQSMHVDDSVAPAVAEYLPAVHFVQLLLALAPVPV